MGKVKDISGQRFGKLVAIKPLGTNSHRNMVWECQCDCGNTAHVTIGSLLSGNTKSCGCLRNGGVIGGRPLDISGQRFGRLVAIKRVGRDANRQSLWLCKCDCGKEVVVRMKSLRRGDTKSCGCIQNREHHENTDNRLYHVWAGMKQRCDNPKHISFKWYGAKGIKVCEEWSRSFLAFKNWANETGYDSSAQRGQFTIDRINPDGDYEPRNCRWVTIEEQQLNKS